MSLLRDQMQIRRSTQVSKTRSLPLIAQITTNSIHSQRNLHMQSSIEIGITSNRKGFVGVQSNQPIANLGRLSEQITPRYGIQFIIVLTGTLFLRQGKGNRSTGIPSTIDQTLPNRSPIQINSDNIGTQTHQYLKRAHGRSRSQQNKVTIAQIDPSRIIHAGNNRISRRWFNGTILHPLLYLCLEFVTRNGFALVSHLQSIGFRRHFSLDITSTKLFFGRRCHHLLKTHRGTIGGNKLKTFIRLLQSRLGKVQCILR